MISVFTAVAAFPGVLGAAEARVAASKPSWTGTWDCGVPLYTMKLTQSGSSVTGTYLGVAPPSNWGGVTGYNGRISGTVTYPPGIDLGRFDGTWSDEGTAEGRTGKLLMHIFVYEGKYAIGLSHSRWGSGLCKGRSAAPTTTAAPPTTTKPATTTAPPPDKTMSYAMPDRFGLKDADGLVRYYSERDQIDPSVWPLVFTLPGCEQSKLDTYAWLVDGKPTVASSLQGRQCQVLADVGTLGKHQVTAKAPGTDQSYTAAVDARDFLILGLGDSVASGEGNPDITKQAGGPRWQDARCDRSAKSFEALAALKIEQHDQNTSVTFVHLACSGAAIKTGVTSPYWGITPGDANLPLMSQAGGIKQLIGSRPIDAVMISIGANDVGFGPVLGFCVKWGDCPNATYEDGKTLRQVIKERLAGLPALYDALAGRLTPLVPSNRVYLNLYPDELRDASGNLCDDMIDYHSIRAIRADEAKWMYDEFMTPLNATIEAAAKKWGWNVITGSPEAFRTHGYCAGKDAWVVTYDESFATQGDQNGTMHPNAAGHQAMAGFAGALLTRDLYPGGKPRPIGAAGGGSGTGGRGTQPSGNPAQTLQQAAEAISSLLKQSAAACGYTSWTVRVSGTPGSIQAVATTSGTLSGTATWSLIAAVAKPTNALAARVAGGCR